MDYDFNRFLADAARELAQQPSVVTTLEHVVELCVESVAGCDDAAISVLEGGAIRTLASTDPGLLRLDRLQVEAGEGPCYEALRAGEVVLTNDLPSGSRWPEWGPRVASDSAHRSVLSFRLFASDDAAGALILYSHTGHGFERDDLHEAQVLAAQASVALATTLKERQLHQALETRTVIGQATGILIERFGLTPDQAFAVMRRVSQHHNIKLHTLAEHLVQTGVLLDPTGHVDGQHPTHLDGVPADGVPADGVPADGVPADDVDLAQ